MTFVARTRKMVQTHLKGGIDLLVVALCLVPTVGFLLAWHMQVDLPTFGVVAVIPALLALMAAELWMAKHTPDLLERFSQGLVGGVVATLAFDVLRLPAAYLAKGAPDFVPLIGQHLVGEAIGIAPSVQALLLGYGYHYLLIGALLGGAYALVAGRLLRPWGVIAGLGAGLIGASLPQFQLLSVGTGFSPETAGAILMAALGVAGIVLGSVVQRLADRPVVKLLPITFLPESHVKTK